MTGFAFKTGDLRRAIARAGLCPGAKRSKGGAKFPKGHGQGTRSAPALKAAALALAAGTASFPAAAQGPVTVFGSSDARICYQEARFGLAVFTGLEACDTALNDTTLSRPDRIATLVNRGILYNRAKRYDQAIASFDAALALDEASGEAFLNRGNSYFFQRKFPAALADYDQAIALDTRDLHAAHFNRGLVLEATERFEEALAAYRKSIELRPDFLPAVARVNALTQRLAGAPAE
ncbi:MAG: tetratricopeptide repeat protein [Alphaproteobacteria bacterium]